MIHILTEDGNRELKGRLFPLGKEIKKHLNKTLSDYEKSNGDKTADGYKRLCNILYDMPNGIEYNEMKRLKNYFDHSQGAEETVEYYLNGGRPMQIWIDSTLGLATTAVANQKESAKEIAKPKDVKKPKNTIKPVKPTIDMSKLMSNLVGESIITESHEYLGYLEDYSPYIIFEMFLNKEKPWTNLINPSSYQRALQEFMKFGQLTNFPTNRIYQWFGVIMRNTAILRSLTEIAGHDTYTPIDVFLDTFFYDYDNDEVDMNKWEKYKEQLGDDSDYGAMIAYLDSMQFFEWFQLPDGSDPWSDYGIAPLEQIINEYNDDKSPEEVLVLLNKALDVIHCRGDLASIFIVGGRQTLSKISEERFRNKKMIQITEQQANILKQRINEAADEQFSLKELTSIPNFNKRVQYCKQHLGMPIGNGSSRIVFQISDEKVLKLAKNTKGIEQNRAEDDYCINVSPTIFERDDKYTWLVSEYVLPAKKQDFKECLGISFEDFVGFLRRSNIIHNNARVTWGAMQYEQYLELLENNEDLQEFDEYIGNYNPPIGDLTRLANYGMTLRSNIPTIVLLDAGLTEDIYNTYYKKF